MQKTTEKQLDEELSDTLIAISVIAKRIARKLHTKKSKGGKTDVKDERTFNGT